MIARIPATVTKLDLGWNDLKYALAADLVKMVAAIPAIDLKIAFHVKLMMSSKL